MKRIIYLFAILAFGVNAFAQETNPEATEEKKEETQEFKISAEIRPRMEYYHGYKTLAAPDQEHGLSISQRTRLNMDFNNSNFIVRLSLQDVRIWGDEPQLATNDTLGNSIHEAWGEAIISPIFSIKVGRQEIVYDDHRIFGNVGWAQQARSHDAAVFKLKTGDLRAELAIAYNQNNAYLNTTVNNPVFTYKAFQNLWMNYKFSDQFDASLLVLNNGLQTAGGGDAYSQTVGTRLSYKTDAISAHLAGYYQGGEDASTTDVKANYFSLDATYKVNDMFSAGLGYERLSGNDQTDPNNENNAFTPFYGTNHKFNGHMDYFYVGNPHGGVGLQDIFLQLNAKMPKFTIGINAHYFLAAADVADPVNAGETMSKALGNEIDLFFGFNLTKGVAFKGGYSQMFATATMEAVKGGSKDETSNWGYAMITFTPELFSHKK
ncbi:MAG: hypothetical protein HC831_11060 [Chloroflexia bacterium]|nr:hypothetical protein [Chloroflexia bacterium]